MLLALDTPKLWERFSLGLESTASGRLLWGELLLLISPGLLRGPLGADPSVLTCFQRRRPGARRWTCEPERRCCAVKSATSPARAACRPPARRPCWDRLCGTAAQKGSSSMDLAKAGGEEADSPVLQQA